MKVATLRAFAVVQDGEAASRLHRIFEMAPDRELVGMTRKAAGAFEAIVEGDVQSVYVETEIRGTHSLLSRLRRSWPGHIRAFSTTLPRHVKAGCAVVRFEELAEVLDALYASHLGSGHAPISLDFQNLVLDSLYLRSADEDFVILTYEGELVFYGHRAAGIANLPYPPPPGLTEADVDQLVGTAHGRDVVTSDDGRAFAERFWIRLVPTGKG